MNEQEIEKYLKTAAELEASVYAQDESIKSARTYLYYNDPEKEHHKKVLQIADRKDSLTRPVTKDHVAKPVYKKATPTETTCIVIGIFALIVYLAFSVSAKQMTLSYSTFLFLGIAIFCFYKCYSLSKNRKAENNRNEIEYQKNLNAAEERYQNMLSSREQQLNDLGDDMLEQEKKLKRDMQKRKIAEDNLADLEKSLEASKKVLKDLYALDIVFPKYRNLIAMCTMYEYFASGRCTELKGPNGAYNLYEAELRQNLIIGKLENISEKLSEIKDSQYILYTTLQETNMIVAGVADDITKIADATNDIRDSMSISNEIAEATRKNTEALKYISLVNAAH